MSRDKRLNRTPEVDGSSPISSTTSNPFVGKGAPLRAERPLRCYGWKRTPTK